MEPVLRSPKDCLDQLQQHRRRKDSLDLKMRNLLVLDKLHLAMILYSLVTNKTAKEVLLRKVLVYLETQLTTLHLYCFNQLNLKARISLHSAVNSVVASQAQFFMAKIYLLADYLDSHSHRDSPLKIQEPSHKM